MGASIPDSERELVSGRLFIEFGGGPALARCAWPPPMSVCPQCFRAPERVYPQSAADWQVTGESMILDFHQRGVGWPSVRVWLRTQGSWLNRLIPETAFVARLQSHSTIFLSMGCEDFSFPSVAPARHPASPNTAPSPPLCLRERLGQTPRRFGCRVRMPKSPPIARFY